MKQSPKFSLVEGKYYQVLNTKFTNTHGMMSVNSTHEFIGYFPCFDARFHGAADPSDYIVYQFKLPANFGIVSFYQYQILEIKEMEPKVN